MSAPDSGAAAETSLAAVPDRSPPDMESQLAQRRGELRNRRDLVRQALLKAQRDMTVRDEASDLVGTVTRQLTSQSGSELRTAAVWKQALESTGGNQISALQNVLLSYMDEVQLRVSKLANESREQCSDGAGELRSLEAELAWIDGLLEGSKSKPDAGPEGAAGAA